MMALSDIFFCENSLSEQDICEIDMSLSFGEGMTMSFLSIKVEYIYSGVRCCMLIYLN